MNLTTTGVILRFLFALLLVLLTYNPSGYSYTHWVLSLSHFTPYVAIAGLLLVIGWGVYINATLNSLGLVGIAILAALFGSLVWLFIYWGWFSLTDVSAMSWVVAVLVAAVLAVGMCWSHLMRRWSGQVDVDEIESK